ncbi:hypothetical protein N9112_00305 [bacterium]|nr:hypothetical protein [bacterium]
MSNVKTAFLAEDGTVFETKSAAEEHNRRDTVKAALMTLTEANTELSDWLLEQKNAVLEAFSTGKVKMVKKAERNALRKQLEKVVKEMGDDVPFIKEHIETIVESFKFKSKRITGEDRDAAILEQLTALTDNAELASWIQTKQPSVEEAYKAGIVKRQVSPKATEALAAYRAKKAAEKAAKEAAE